MGKRPDIGGSGRYILLKSWLLSHRKITTLENQSQRFWYCQYQKFATFRFPHTTKLSHHQSLHCPPSKPHLNRSSLSYLHEAVSQQHYLQQNRIITATCCCPPTLCSSRNPPLNLSNNRVVWGCGVHVAQTGRCRTCLQRAQLSVLASLDRLGLDASIYLASSFLDSLICHLNQLLCSCW